MANQEHVDLLKQQGVESGNQWRWKQNPIGRRPYLTNVDASVDPFLHQFGQRLSADEDLRSPKMLFIWLFLVGERTGMIADFNTDPAPPKQ